MRRAVGVFFAASLLVTMVATSPAGAANTTLPKCKSLSGTQTYTPGLPKIGDPKLVKPVVNTSLKIVGCTGGGITSGTSTGSTKATKGENCTTLAKGAGKPGAASKGVIKWSNGQTSTTSNVLTQTSKAGASPIVVKLVSKYTAGLGKGKTSTAIIKAVPNKGFCITAPFSKATFKSTSVK